MTGILYDLMGFSSSVVKQVLPDPLLDSDGEPVYWVEDPSDSDYSKLLRPDFSVSWTKNSAWHAEFYASATNPDMIKKHTALPQYRNALRAMKPAEISSHMATSGFKVPRDRYLKQKKSMPEKEAQLQTARVNTRKSDVSFFEQYITDANFNKIL